MAPIAATCYLLGVSTRRMEKLVESLGITSLSKSQVSVMAADLDDQVEAFRTRPLNQGPYTFVAADALVLKVRENGRVVNVHCLGADLRDELAALSDSATTDGRGSGSAKEQFARRQSPKRRRRARICSSRASSACLSRYRHSTNDRTTIRVNSTIESSARWLRFRSQSTSTKAFDSKPAE